VPAWLTYFTMHSTDTFTFSIHHTNAAVTKLQWVVLHENRINEFYLLNNQFLERNDFTMSTS